MSYPQVTKKKNTHVTSLICICFVFTCHTVHSSSTCCSDPFLVFCFRLTFQFRTILRTIKLSQVNRCISSVQQLTSDVDLLLQKELEHLLLESESLFSVMPSVDMMKKALKEKVKFNYFLNFHFFFNFLPIPSKLTKKTYLEGD